MLRVTDREEPCTGCGHDVVLVSITSDNPRSRARRTPFTPKHAERTHLLGDAVDEGCTWPNYGQQ